MGQQAGEQEHEGQRYLDMLDLGHLSGQEIRKADGTIIQARDFLEVCGEHALPVLKGFETMTPQDPRYAQTRDMLQGLIGQYLQGETAE